jgi:uncharacterized protein with LGFP repeats
LGFPITDEGRAWDYERSGRRYKGHFQRFEGGSVYFCEGVGAHAILDGAIYQRFAEREARMEAKGTQMTGGILGFPSSGVEAVTSSTGIDARVQCFLVGCIVSWPKGTFVVSQGFYDIYCSVGRWKGLLGLPTSDDDPWVAPHSGTSGRMQQFEAGCMQWVEERGFYIHGPIFRKWQDTRALGFATSTALYTPDATIQHFEGGRILSRDSGCEVQLAT